MEEDYRWLVSHDARPWLAEVACDTGSIVKLAARLRKHLTLQRSHLVLEQIELRRRARRKFSHSERLFFSRVGLQQSTDQQLAEYKSGRFKDNCSIIDLCCGIGGDLMALSEAHEVVGVEIDPATAVLAEANCRAIGRRVNVYREDARDAQLQGFDAWHLDPDRRPSGRRSVKADNHEPGIDILDRLLKKCPNGSLKLAPAAEMDSRWTENAELEWISDGRECKQLVAWWGDLAKNVGQRVATVISSHFPDPITWVGQANQGLDRVSNAARYILEPDPAALAAGLAGSLAATYRLHSLTPGGGYLTSDHLVDDPILTPFEVFEAMSFDRKRLKAALQARGIGRVVVKKRGVDINVNQLQRFLMGKGDRSATVILVGSQSRTLSLLTHRVCQSTY